MKRPAPAKVLSVLVRIVLCAVLAAIGWLGMGKLSRMKKPPAEAEATELALHVETMAARTETVRVKISGFGEAASLNVVRLAAEVAGRVVYVHPRLEVGEQLARDEVLLRLDPRDYEAAVARGEASLQAYADTVARLEKQLVIDQSRLSTLTRNLELAEKEYARAKRLFEQDEVGTLAGVEGAERLVNTARDAVDRLQGLLDTYPLQIREARSQSRVAEAQLTSATANLGRCEIRSPVDGRIESTRVETGQYVAPGTEVLALADDSELELRVPLETRDVQRWLQFQEGAASPSIAWFAEPVHVPVTVQWTEAPDTHAWTGTLHRIVALNRETRTIDVAIRIKGPEAAAGAPGALPLVAGMYCSVEIPGREMANVIRLPRWAVSFRNTVFVVKDGRLKTVPVEVARRTGDHAFVTSGLQAGDAVIVTRLVNPLEGTKLEAVPAGGEETPE
ncbi:MAG: efflux RND transporter periplasmic adaptor subunit [Lentisphaerae bacterium]|nr:efflux RND transporter periplasmic adaptor subunit [Lentisphaerota bacterium]